MPGVEDALEFIQHLFGAPRTQCDVYLSSLANERDGSPEIRLQTRDPDRVERFIAKNDRAGRGLFICAGTVNGKRNKDNIAESVGAYCDIDFKDHPDTPALEIGHAIGRAKLKPTIQVHTGHGLHLWWLFHGGIEAQSHRNRLETVLRALAEHLGGDTQVAEISRLMRLPGTHNTKFDSWVPVIAHYAQGNTRYTLEQLEEWQGSNNLKPLLQRRVAVSANPLPGDAPTTPENPFIAIAQAQGYQPPIDVEALLAGMVYPGNVHATQLSVSAALLERGHPPQEVVARLLAETQKLASTGKFNWRKEERDLAKMCASWLDKHPPKSRPDEKAHFEGQHDNVTDIGAERTKRKPVPAPKQEKVKKHIVLAKGVLAAMHDRGELLMTTNIGNYAYIDNLWRLVLDKELHPWLDAQLEAGAQVLEMQTDKRLIGEARAWILRQPDLHKTNVPFDDHGMVPTRSGLVDPRTKQLITPSPDQFVTWRVECDYVPTARCPHWLRMMDDALGDRDDTPRAELIALLQELLGAGLIDARGKALSKALVFWGTNDTAKSGLLDVMAGLYGGVSNETPFKALEGTHGLMPFEKRRPWLLHEAFDQGAWFFSSTVKSLISGDPVSINMKNGPFISRRMRAPILWGTNHRPQFKEATRAMAERMVIIRCRRQFKQNDPVGVAAIARQRGYDKPDALVLDTEMEGLLAWAITGLARCLKRGFFNIPEEVSVAADDIARDSNIVAGFIEDCIDFDRNSMISTQDFAGAFNVWWVENRGDDAHVPSSYSIGKYLVSHGDARIAIDARELRVSAQRFYAGIALNVDGKRCWKDMHASDVYRLKERKTGMSAVGENPNKPIPSTWKDKASIKAMRKACAMDDTSKGASDISKNVSEDVSPTQASDRKGEPRF